MNDEGYIGRAPAPGQAPAWMPPVPPPPPPPPPGAASGRRPNRALVVAAIVAVLIAGAGIGVLLGLLTRGATTTPGNNTSPDANAGTSTVQARALYQKAMAAMRGSAGFHYIADSTGPTGKQTIVGDATPSGGRQDITFDASLGHEQFTLVLVSAVVYFEGNGPALEDQLGVPAASASSLQGKWISVSNQDAPYSVVAPGITVADQVTQTPLLATSTTSISTAGATRILGTVPSQQGAPAGTGHLDIAAGSHLPIAYVSTLSASGVTATSKATFSGWGTAVATVAPTGAVAWSTLGASAPPGGFGSGGGSLTPPSSTPQL
jgi:hypothetical protein